MATDEMLHVEVAYALPDHQTLLSIRVPQGATVRDAILQSGILSNHPEIDLSSNKVGVFGKLAKLDAALREGDRVEIYRPLTADPKEVRKLRAAQGKKMKRGGSDGEKS